MWRKRRQKHKHALMEVTANNKKNQTIVHINVTCDDHFKEIKQMEWEWYFSWGRKTLDMQIASILLNKTGFHAEWEHKFTINYWKSVCHFEMAWSIILGENTEYLWSFFSGIETSKAACVLTTILGDGYHQTGYPEPREGLQQQWVWHSWIPPRKV